MMDDIDRIMEVMGSAFEPKWGEAWNRNQVSSSLSLPTTSYTLIDSYGQFTDNIATPAGFTLVRSAPGEDELLLIAVRPEYRGKGFGRRLLEKFIVDARTRGAEKAFLEMRENNEALQLYREAGFTQIGRRKNYYKTSDNERLDAITFCLIL
nr:ribosomal protein S18-alanine N-acetyltransferase [Parerythrobacter lutipelagi]